MSCALRCKAVSPSKLGHPRTHGTRSKGIHQSSGIGRLATVSILVLVPYYPAHLR